MNLIRTIALRVGLDELLWLLVEECAELIHAVAKLRRVRNSKNPTPVTEEEAKAALLEEIADVSICLTALGADSGLNRMKIQAEVDRKTRRWAERLGIDMERDVYKEGRSGNIGTH